MPRNGVRIAARYRRALNVGSICKLEWREKGLEHPEFSRAWRIETAASPSSGRRVKGFEILDFTSAGILKKIVSYNDSSCISLADRRGSRPGPQLIPSCESKRRDSKYLLSFSQLHPLLFHVQLLLPKHSVMLEHISEDARGE